MDRDEGQVPIVDQIVRAGAVHGRLIQSVASDHRLRHGQPPTLFSLFSLGGRPLPFPPSIFLPR